MMSCRFDAGGRHRRSLGFGQCHRGFGDRLVVRKLLGTVRLILADAGGAEGCGFWSYFAALRTIFWPWTRLRLLQIRAQFPDSDLSAYRLDTSHKLRLCHASVPTSANTDPRLRSDTQAPPENTRKPHGPGRRDTPQLPPDNPLAGTEWQGYTVNPRGGAWRG